MRTPAYAAFACRLCTIRWTGTLQGATPVHRQVLGKAKPTTLEKNVEADEQANGCSAPFYQVQPLERLNLTKVEVVSPFP